MRSDGTRRYLFPLMDGRFMEVKDKKVTCALPYIERRIEYYMPIDMIDVDEMLKVISFIRVNPNRDCTPEEVCQMVNQIKGLLVEAIGRMPKHQRYLYERGNSGENDRERLEGDPQCGESNQRDES